MKPTRIIFKSIAIAFYIMLVFTAGCGIFESDSDHSDTFDKTLELQLGESIEAHHVAPSENGYFITATSSFDNGQNKDIHLIETDAGGTILWEKTFGGPDKEIANDVLDISDQGLLIVGSSTSFNDNRGEIYAIKTGAGGGVEWAQSYGDESESANIVSTEGHSVIKTSDGGYLIGGTAFSSQGTQLMYLLQLDGSGNKRWTKTLSGKGRQINAMLQTPDGGYLLTGDASDNTYLVKTDAEGELVWERQLGKDSSVYKEILGTEDGGYLIGGTEVDNNSSTIRLIKTDEKGELIWTNRYASTGSTAVNVIVKADDNSFLVGGSEKMEPSFQRMYLRKIDSEGRSIWDRFYEQGTRSKITGLSIVEEAIIIVGTSESEENKTRVRLLKTDLNGNR